MGSPATSPAPDGRPWRARDAVYAVSAGLAASAAVALALSGGGLSETELFVGVIPAQAVATLGAAAAMARRRGATRKLLGLDWRWSDLWGLLVGAGVQIGLSLVAFVVIESFFDGEVPGQQLVEAAEGSAGLTTRAFLVIGLVVLGPISEEVVFRGVLLSALLHRGKRQAVAISSIAFALLHLLDPGAAFSVPFLLVLAVILAQVRLRTGSLGRPIAIHAGFNTVTVLAIFAGA